MRAPDVANVNGKRRVTRVNELPPREGGAVWLVFVKRAGRCNAFKYSIACNTERPAAFMSGEAAAFGAGVAR